MCREGVYITLAVSGGEAVCINVTLTLGNDLAWSMYGSVDPRVIGVLALCLHFLFFSRPLILIKVMHRQMR